MKICLTLLALFLCLTCFSQNENVFLNRDYWKSNPSLEQVKTQIEEGHDISELNSYAFDPVVYALLENVDNATIEYMVKQLGNDVNKITHDGRTYIFWAAYKGNVDFMTYLLNHGAKTDVIDDKGNSILNFAASTGQQNTKVYDLCIANGIQPKIDLTPNGANALLLAAPSDQDFKLMNYFTAQGLDIHSVDRDGNGVFNYVAKTGNIKMMNALLEKGIKGSDQAFIYAAYGTRRNTNGIEVYKFLENLGLQVNTVNKEGISPLHIVASRNNNLALVSYLLSKGLEVDAKDTNGNTVLMNAVSRNTLEIVKVLVEHIKDINSVNKKGQSALSLAVQNNAPEVIAFLLEKGAKPSITDKDGNNISYYLAQSFSKDNSEAFFNKMELLKTNGFELETVQDNRNSWFHMAVDKQSLDLLKLALKMKQDINAKNAQGYTALHLAAMTSKDNTMLEYLIENGATKTATTDFEETAYDLALENELLKKNKVSVEFLK